MAFWIVKCSSRLADGSDGWHWDRYFTGDDGGLRKRFDFGGPRWIRSAWSKKFIREEVKEDDLVVCYQKDGRELCGLTRMRSDGLDDPRGSGDYNLFYLDPAKDALRFDPPMTVAALREKGCSPVFLSKGQGTIFPLSRDEFDGIIDTVKELMPAARQDLSGWLRHVSYSPSVRARRLSHR